MLTELAEWLHDRAARIDAEHSRPPYKSGPKRGQVRYDNLWWHGYRDALEDARMHVQDVRDARLAELAALAAAEVTS